MNLNRLYQEMILEHNKKPRNFKKVDPHTHYSHGLIHYVVMTLVSIRLDNNDLIDDIGFIGQGCAISKASGSLM